MIEVLEIFKGQLDALGVDSEFQEWTQDVKYPYWVYDYIEEPMKTEDFQQRPTLILTGFTKGAALELEKLKEKIKQHFRGGVRVKTDKGSAVVIAYSRGGFIPTGDKDLKKIEIYLETKKWSE